MSSKAFHHRNRKITACLECRRRRRKCDRLEICSNCRSAGKTCVFLPQAAKSNVPGLLKAYKIKLAESDRVLTAENVTNTGESYLLRDGLSHPSVSCQWLRIIGNEELPPANWEQESPPWPVATAMIILNEDWVNINNLDDLYVGRMSLAPRVSGFFRRDILYEVQALGKSDSFLGMPDSADILQVWTPKPLLGETLDDIRDLFHVQTTHQYQPSLPDLLPLKSETDELMHCFRVGVHPIACTLRWSHLVARYNAFWSYRDRGVEPPPALVALISSVMYSAAISVSCSDPYNTSQRTPSRRLVRSLQNAAETALIQARYLHSSDMETLQALVVYLTSEFRGQLTLSHCSVLRSAIQIAESMGLHRDGSSLSGLSAEEITDRRLLWLQLCVLDMRGCESYGPRLGIRSEDYDVLVSLNAEPEDEAVAPNQHQCTIFNMIRFECNQMRRLAWNDMRKLETAKISLNSTLKKIDNFNRAISAKYSSILKGDDTFKSYSRKFLEYLIENIYVMILFPYYKNSYEEGYATLQDQILFHIMRLLEFARELENTTQYASWAWNLSSYQQYYAAYPLLVESLVHPTRLDSERLWGILDFVFGCSPLLSKEAISLAILESLMAKIPKLHLRLGIGPCNYTSSGSTGRTSITSAGGNRCRMSPTESFAFENTACLNNESLDIDWEEFDRLFKPNDQVYA